MSIFNMNSLLNYNPYLEYVTSTYGRPEMSQSAYGAGLYGGYGGGLRATDTGYGSGYANVPGSTFGEIKTNLLNMFSSRTEGGFLDRRTGMIEDITQANEATQAAFMEDSKFRAAFDTEFANMQADLEVAATALKAEGGTSAGSTAEFAAKAQKQIQKTKEYLREIKKVKKPKDIQVMDTFIDPMSGKAIAMDSVFEDFYDMTQGTESALRKGFDTMFKSTMDKQKAIKFASRLGSEAFEILGMDEEAFRAESQAQLSQYMRSLFGGPGGGLGQFFSGGAGSNTQNNRNLFDVSGITDTQLTEFMEKYGSQIEQYEQAELDNYERAQLDYALANMSYSFRNDNGIENEYTRQAQQQMATARSQIEAYEFGLGQAERDALLSMFGPDAFEDVDYTYGVAVDKGGIKGMFGAKNTEMRTGTFNTSFALQGISNQELYGLLADRYVTEGLATERENQILFRDEFNRRRKEAEDIASAQLKQNELNKTRAARIAEEETRVEMLAERQYQQYTQTLSSQGGDFKGTPGAGISFSDTRPM